MSVARYVNLSFAVTGIILYMVLSSFFGFVIELFGSSANVAVLGNNFRLGHLLGMTVSIATAVMLRKNEKVHAYAMEVGTEISKVTWPTWKDTKRATLVVIVTTVVVSIVLGLLDLVWSSLSRAFYS
jgi:preprotein translocase SecE subunit